MCGGGKGQSTSKNKSNNSWTPTGLPQLQNIYNVANTASQIPYAPYTGQLVAGVNQDQINAGQQFSQAFGYAQPFMAESANLFGQSAQDPNSNGLIQSFYNPMASNVMANLKEVFGQQMNETTGNLQQAAGGVGADRVAVGQAELARQQGLAAGQTMAGLYQQAIQGAQGQQGLQQAAGFGFGQLGPAMEQGALSAANAEMGFGTLEQQTQQNQLNAQYQQFLRQQGYPFQTGQYLAGIGIPAASAMGGTGTGLSQGTYTPAQPSPISQGVQAGMAVLPFLAKGGRVKHYDMGGDVFGETQFDVNGYVPKQSQPIQAAPYSGMPMGMAMNNPALMNSMAGYNPLTGSAGNASAANNPMALAKQYQDIYKQGQAAKGGLDDLIQKAAQHGLIDEDTAGDLTGWGTTTDTTDAGTVPTSARGGAINGYADGGSPFNDITSMAYDVMPGGYLTNYAKQWASGDPMSRYRDAIAHVESAGKGDYSAVNPGSHALGRYQVMPQYLSPWLKEAGMDSMTPQQFLNDHDAQDKLFNFKFGQSLDKYGNPQDAASVWFSGRPLAHNGSIDQWTGLSVPGYVGRFNNALRSQGSGSSAPNDMGANASLEFANRAPAPAQAPSSSPFAATGTAGAMPPPQNAAGTMAMQQPQAAPAPRPSMAMTGAPDYEQAYLQGQIHGTSPFAAARGGSIRGFATYGGVEDDDDPAGFGGDPIGAAWGAFNEIKKTAPIGRKTGTSNVSPVETQMDPNALGTDPNAVVTNPEYPKDAPGMDTNFLASPSPDADAKIEPGALTKYGTSSRYLLNPSLGGVNMNLDPRGAVSGTEAEKLGPASEDKAADAGPNPYAQAYGDLQKAVKQVQDRSQIPTIPTLFHGDQPMTGWRRLMLGAAAGMGNSPWAIPNIAKGLGSGMQSLDTGAKDYLDMANENLKAQQLATELAKPISPGYMGLVSPITGQQVAPPGGALESEDEIKYIADGIKRNPSMASTYLGGGNLGNLNRMAVMRYMSQHPDQYRPEDIAATKLDYTYQSAANRTAGNRMGNLTNVIQDAKNLIPQARQISANMDRTAYPSVNEALQAIRYGTGDPRIRQWVGIRNDIATLVSRAAGGAGASTDLGKQMALDMLPEYGSDKQVQAALDQVQKVLDAYMSGNKEAAQILHDQFTGRSSAGGGGGGAPPQPGDVRTDENGKQWRWVP